MATHSGSDFDQRRRQLVSKVQALKLDDEEKAFFIQSILAAQSWNGASALLEEAEGLALESKVELVPVVVAAAFSPGPAIAPRPEEPRVQPSFHSPGVLGCKHDIKSAKLLAPCCGRWVVCRRCHDEVTDHVMDRYNVKTVWCVRCNLVQDFGKACINCKEPFAPNVCFECRLLTSKDVFHCDSCGVCRVGSKNDFVHCNTCGVCVEKKNHARHQCIPGSHNGNCPICFETMNARICNDPVVFSLCGHPLHEACLKDYIKHNHFKCPLCSKLLGDMTRQFAELRQLILAQPMPPAYRNAVSHVQCHCCNAKSTVPFHFLGHECRACGSFNTAVVQTLGLPDIGSAGAACCSPGSGSGDEDSNMDCSD